MARRNILPSLLLTILNVAWYGLALGLVLAICLLFAPALPDLNKMEMDVPISFTLDGRAFHVTPDSGEIDHARLDNLHGTGRLSFPPPSGMVLASAAGGLALFLAVLMWIVGELRAVFRDVRDGQPFAPANAARVRHIGYAVIGGEVARAALGYVGGLYSVAHFQPEGLRFEARADISVLTIVLGLVIFVIAEVFRAGTRLEEDQTLTV